MSARTAELIAAATFVSFGLMAGSPASGAPAAIPSRPPARSAVSEGRRIGSPAAQRDRRVTTIAARTLASGTVTASLSAGSRPGGATPSSAYYRLEIRSPDGRVIYWNETTIRCGDGRPSRLLPPDGAVGAYC